LLIEINWYLDELSIIILFLILVFANPFQISSRKVALQGLTKFDALFILGV
jgi:hypothetical protein